AAPEPEVEPDHPEPDASIFHWHHSRSDQVAYDRRRCLAGRYAVPGSGSDDRGMAADDTRHTIWAAWPTGRRGLVVARDIHQHPARYHVRPRRAPPARRAGCTGADRCSRSPAFLTRPSYGGPCDARHIDSRGKRAILAPLRGTVS